MENIEILIVETPNEYKNGKIYVIRSNLTDKIYVGSTKHKLNIRFSAHLNKNNTTCSKKLIDLGDARIELIEDYPCNNRKELELRERHFQDLYSANLINMKKAGGKNTESKSRIASNARYYAKHKAYHQAYYLAKKSRF